MRATSLELSTLLSGLLLPDYLEVATWKWPIRGSRKSLFLCTFLIADRALHPKIALRTASDCMPHTPHSSCATDYVSDVVVNKRREAPLYMTWGCGAMTGCGRGAGSPTGLTLVRVLLSPTPCRILISFTFMTVAVQTWS